MGGSTRKNLPGHQPLKAQQKKIFFFYFNKFFRACYKFSKIFPFLLHLYDYLWLSLANGSGCMSLSCPTLPLRLFSTDSESDPDQANSGRHQTFFRLLILELKTLLL